MVVQTSILNQGQFSSRKCCDILTQMIPYHIASDNYLIQDTHRSPYNLTLLATLTRFNQLFTVLKIEGNIFQQILQTMILVQEGEWDNTLHILSHLLSSTFHYANYKQDFGSGSNLQLQTLRQSNLYSVLHYCQEKFSLLFIGTVHVQLDTAQFQT